jgi:hypothetical protein
MDAISKANSYEEMWSNFGDAYMAIAEQAQQQ